MPLASDATQQTQEALAQVPDQESLVGVFVTQAGAIATVDQGASRLSVKSATQLNIVAGDPVRLERRNGELILIGPARARPTTGRVTATGTLTTVEYPNGSGVTAQMRRNSAYTPAIGDLVVIDWTVDGGVISHKYDANPSSTAPTAPPGQASGRYDLQFSAIDSGAYQSGYGWRTNDVWSSDRNIGAWFYGSKIKDTIPDTAVIRNAWIYLPLQQQVGSAPFGYHTSGGKPGGAVSFGALAELGGRDGWIGIPTGLIDYLKANDGGLGYGIGGFNIWRGTQQDGDSGKVRVIYDA